MKPPPFAYARAESAEEAAALLRSEEDAVVLAGGQSLVPMLNLRIARPGTLVDITRIPGLKGVQTTAESYRVGALTTHTDLVQHPWPAGFTALPRAAAHIGYPAIRNRGTIGGSLAHADPAAELPAMMLALDAEIELTSPDGSRSIPADEFFLGYYSTARSADEIVTSITFPIRPEVRTGFAEFSRRDGDFAIALAAVATWETDGGTQARVVVGGLDIRPRRIPELEQALAAGTAWQDLVTMAVLAPHTDPADDIHGSAEYRLHLGVEMLRRSIGDMEGVSQ